MSFSQPSLPDRSRQGPSARRNRGSKGSLGADRGESDSTFFLPRWTMESKSSPKCERCRLPDHGDKSKRSQLREDKSVCPEARGHTRRYCCGKSGPNLRGRRTSSNANEGKCARFSKKHVRKHSLRFAPQHRSRQKVRPIDTQPGCGMSCPHKRGSPYG